MEQENKTIKNMDSEMFDSLFRTYYPRLCVFANNYVNDMDAACEIVQNFFVNFWEKHKTLKITTSLKSYFFSSVYHACMQHFRKQKLHEKYTGYVKTLQEQADYSDILEKTETEQKIYTSIESLPPQCKKIFTLSRFDRLKYKEIAAKLNISVKTVEAQISKALKILGEKLADYLPVLF